MRRRHKRARAEKQEGKYTMKSIFQPQQAGLKFVVAGAPSADLAVMALTVKLPGSLQLGDLGIAALNSVPQGCTKLVHLVAVLCREKFFLLGQPAIKLQSQ
jgi:hypothetical protein